MSDPTSIFGNDPTATQPNSNNVQPQDNLNDLLASVKNERGEQKYKDVNEAIHGLKHAQEYIPTLKNELTAKEQALAVALAKSQELEEANRSLLALTSQRNNEPAPQAAPVLDEKKLAEIVQQTISQREAQATQQANLASVVSTLQHVFGADAEKAYNDKAQELGMSVAELNGIAAKSPQAVFKMLGVSTAPNKGTAAPTQGSVNPAAYQPKPDSFVGRNPKSAMIGATTEDQREASNRAKGMVDELHAQGLTVHDLSDPKVYAKYFGKH